MTRRKSSSTIPTASLLAVVAMCAGFYAVKPLPGVVDADTDWREVGSEIEHPFGEKLVKGAPFSAQVIIESTQTLANGHAATILSQTLAFKAPKRHRR